MSNENRELFNKALAEAMDIKMREINKEAEKEIKNTEKSQTTRRHKIRMNRLFREYVGGPFIPFPTVDNIYERVRSKIIIKLKRFHKE